jgi:sRNA-binding carbon storage regulator CsrA
MGKSLDDCLLRKFLSLSTGADIVIGNDIQVTFTSITGAARN